MLAPFQTRLSQYELLKRTVTETINDDCFSLAAQMAYYFFLSLFPAVLFLLAMASFFPLQNLTDDLGQILSPFVSRQVVSIIQEQMHRLAENDSGGFLTIGVLGALWSSSAALVSLVYSLDKAYGLTERRPWWKVRLLAIVLTLALAGFLLVSLSLVLAGPSVATYLGETLGYGEVFEWSWKILQWPVAFGLVTGALAIVYYFGPDAEQRWTWVLPGAIAGTIVWMLSSLGFKLYVSWMTDYTASYGAIGGVVVLMLWFYVSGLAILVGAELNAEIEHASPYGKNPGERVAPEGPSDAPAGGVNWGG